MNFLPLFCRTLGKRCIAMNGTERKNVMPGCHVKVVQKQHQRTGELTEGVVKDILTKSPVHPHGIKVRLDSGIIGRVHEVVESKNSLQYE
jgi:uncharacterized repeat protein (TIGR03833 family)